MAIKHGQILTVANSFVVDRIQTAGPGNLNIPQEKVYELGNFNAVGIIRDIPDLSYDLESVDVSTDGEALVLRRDPADIRGSRSDAITTTSASATVVDKAIRAVDTGRLVATGTTGVPAGSYVGTVTTRTDTGCGTTAGSKTVTDASIVSADTGRSVVGAGIPAGSYVGTVSNGVSFELSSSPSGQVDVAATATGTVSLHLGVSFLLSSSATSQVNVTATVSGSTTALLGGDRLDFADAVPLDIISPFKAGQNLYNIVSGLALPWLTLENVTYRFGQRANAAQTFTLRGDSVFYIPGTPVYDEFPYSAGGVYTLTSTALAYAEEGSDHHVLSVCWVDAASGTSGRLFYGLDYTDTAADFTLLAPTAIPSTSRVCAVYGTATAGTYPQTVHTPANTVKPAAIRGKDIDIYVGPQGGPLVRWTSVQSFEATRRVNLQADEEFGNPHYVDQDYDTADITGNVVVRPRNPQELIAKVQQIVGESDASKVVGALSSDLVEVEARLRHPDTGVVLKTIFIPDARFTPPAVQGRVNQRQDTTFPYTSEEGLAYVYKGLRVT